MAATRLAADRSDDLGSLMNGAIAMTWCAEVLVELGLGDASFGPAEGSVSALADGYEIVIPLAALGEDNNGLFSFKVVSLAQVSDASFSAVLDIMPDVGLAPGRTHPG
jgi:hypothetical protein